MNGALRGSTCSMIYDVGPMGVGIYLHPNLTRDPKLGLRVLSRTEASEMTLLRTNLEPHGIGSNTCALHVSVGALWLNSSYPKSSTAGRGPNLRY